MPAGLQTWDAAGRLRLDTSVRMANLVGSVYTNGTNGSLVTDTSKGTPFFYVTCPSETGPEHLLPIVSYSGNTLSWQYIGGDGDSIRFGVTITYGFF